ncbi:Prefoldin, subunit 3 [Neoconidiobolus thromboides FSU 785]|nr:Prefoldin, subunit 3 [Neoconidiobolus thromboides FSU 785]
MDQKVETNARGIPKAPFVEEVEDYMSVEGRNADKVLREFSEAISKYRFMEANMLQRKQGLDSKIPEIQKSFDMVNYLIGKQESDDKINVNYELNDTLYAKATIEPTNSIYLWLGANVMVEYNLEEAHSLLKAKLELATRSKDNATQDLEFLREQITTMEVNTARVYNWDIIKRREAKAKA